MLAGCVSISDVRLFAVAVPLNTLDSSTLVPEKLRVRIERLQADEHVVVSSEETHYVFLSGRDLREGRLHAASPGPKEKAVVVVREGQVISTVLTMQVRRASGFHCQYVVHQGGCGSDDVWSCEQWGGTSGAICPKGLVEHVQRNGPGT